MSIAFIVGTTAELIKLAPVMHELDSRGVPYQIWATAQHVTGVPGTANDLNVRRPDRVMIAPRQRKHITRSRQIPAWASRVMGYAIRHRSELAESLRGGDVPPTVVVHGDTFSTVLGARIGRFIGARVAHVEAGLRSGSIRSPFPEELNRRAVGKIATLHFAPTPREIENLEREEAPGEYIETGANTVVDALRYAMDSELKDIELPDVFGLVTLHRFELLRQPDQFTAVLRTLAENHGEVPLVMVAGDAERQRIEELGLGTLFGDTFRIVGKRPYAAFLPILVRASFVVTDSGGLQEECAALGVPCAVHRERTERHQGLGQNVVLTGMNTGKLQEFLQSWEEFKYPSQLDTLRPSEIIADRLAKP
ncbi:MAG TPA: UDP-N-acetylglucosamine 2-epimerase [Actinomycetaceae bacterium]|nr:UDP-N-acetylglucosamine 2-epimerase [Actinomycetaceae bacterium]